MLRRLYAQQQLTLEPPHDSGQGITPAYEGCFENPDGTLSLLFGYFNRNLKQELDIPAGPDNRIEPGGPDRGQPTHFLVARQWGVFTVTVPKGFQTNKLTWTLTANGKTSVVPANLNPLYLLAPVQRRHRKHAAVYRFCRKRSFCAGAARAKHVARDHLAQSGAAERFGWPTTPVSRPARRRPSTPPVSFP